METTVLKGKIKKMFQNCPKPNGWFGCFFTDDDLGDVMVTLSHIKRLFQSCENCQFVFVGDENQLGSIGAGRFFSDICSMSEISKTELSICYRSESQLIIDNANVVLSGEPWKKIHCDGESFMFYPNAKTDDSYLSYLCMVYQGYLQDGVDFNEITILSPVKTGPVGVKNLNLALQNVLNPKKVMTGPNAIGDKISRRGFEIPNTYYAGYNSTYTRLHVGDKVMQTVNRPAPYVKDGRLGDGISNGDCGIIVDYYYGTDNDGKLMPYLQFQTDDGRVYKISEKYFGELELAYAMTIHKAQGCEWNTVVLSMPDTITHYPSDFDFASRNLLFTGLTRAKSSVSVIGSLLAIERCIQTLPHHRNSLLCEYVREELNQGGGKYGI